MAIALIGADIVTPATLLRGGTVLMDRGRIKAVGDAVALPPRARKIDLAGRTLVPGYIDVHLHGAVGDDAMDDDPGALPRMSAALAMFGVTGFLATTVAAPLDLLDRRLRAVTQILDGTWAGAAVLGIRSEGPFFAADHAGAQPPASLLAPDLETCRRLIAVADGAIRIMDLAPELPGAHDLIRFLVSEAVAVSAAHSHATYDEFEAAVDAGLTHCAHLFNAMPPFHHREPGLVGGALTDPRVTVELICDFIHLHPAAVELTRRAKGPDKIILISDAMRAAGLSDGLYDLGGQRVEVTDRRAYLVDRKHQSGEPVLAGSTLTLDLAVRNVVTRLGWPLTEAVAMATANPARLLGLEGRKGCIAPGADADLAILNPDLSVWATLVGGNFVYRAEEE